MRKPGKFGILGICLLTFGLATGSIIPFIHGNSVVVAASPCPPTPRAIGPAETQAINEINAARQGAVVSSSSFTNAVGVLGGLPVTVDTGASLTGAQNHATYLANNPGEFQKSFEDATVSPTCFTPTGNIAARYAAKFSNVVSLTEAVELALDSIYLRLPLFDPTLQKVGLGFDTSFAVIDDTNANSTTNYAPPISSTNPLSGYVIGYPGSNALSIPVSTTLIAGEGVTQTILAPKPRIAGGFTGTGQVGIYGNPLPGGDPVPGPVRGYPISVNLDRAVYAAPGSFLTVLTNTLSTITGTVPINIIPPSIIDGVYSALYGNPGVNGTPIPYAYVMVPTAPLTPATQYTVNFGLSFKANSSVITPTIVNMTWNFTTQSGPPPVPTPTPTPNNGGIPGYTPIIVPTSAALTPTPTPALPGVPGRPSGGGPTSFYKPRPVDGENPPLFFQIWRRVDDPVKYGLTSRSWIYGPLPYGLTMLYENYEGGTRIVAYHDKARMEITNPDAGYVSNGLLVKELISGALQLGDTIYDFRTPSFETVAGEPFELNPLTPTYAAFGNVASMNNDKRSPDRTGQTVIETMDRNGNVGSDGNLSAYGVTYAYYDPNLGHNIPNRFWDFMNQQGLVLGDSSYFNDTVFNWVTVMGLPLSDPYWVKAVVGGQVRDVLVQPFERRILTFTPSNDGAFQVEMGNVGRSYYKWRYGQEP